MFFKIIKNTSLLIFALAFFAFPNSTLAADWTEASKGDVMSLRSITKSGDNLIAVGNTGKLIYSKDGETWDDPITKGAAWFFKVGKVAGKNLLAAGENGLFITSEDDGKSWVQINYGVTKDIYDFESKGKTGYMVGAGGTFYYYNPNANIWTSGNVGLTTDLHGAHDMGDNAIGWVVGNDGRVVKVSQGGLAYYVIPDIPKETLYDIVFLSDTTGFIVGKMGTVLKTTDSGASWTKLSINGLTNETLYSVDASGDNVAIAGDKILIVSEDAGVTWDVQSLAGTLNIFRDVFFESSTSILAVGTDYDVKSIVYKYDLTPKVSGADANLILTPEPIVDKPVAEAKDGEANPGSLVKLTCKGDVQVNDPCKAVYFYATDGKRHAFPNDKVFFTWFDDFDSVREVTPEFLSTIPLGKNVTYHPGVKMVKFKTVNTVYAVSKKGELKAIGSEVVAKSLYGDDWNKKIDDISDAFYGNYTFGTKIISKDDYRVDLTKESVSSLNDNF